MIIEERQDWSLSKSLFWSSTLATEHVWRLKHHQRKNHCNSISFHSHWRLLLLQRRVKHCRHDQCLQFFSAIRDSHFLWTLIRFLSHDRTQSSNFEFFHRSLTIIAKASLNRLSLKSSWILLWENLSFSTLFPFHFLSIWLWKVKRVHHAIWISASTDNTYSHVSVSQSLLIRAHSTQLHLSWHFWSSQRETIIWSHHHSSNIYLLITSVWQIVWT